MLRSLTGWTSMGGREPVGGSSAAAIMPGGCEMARKPKSPKVWRARRRVAWSSRSSHTHSDQRGGLVFEVVREFYQALL